MNLDEAFEAAVAKVNHLMKSGYNPGEHAMLYLYCRYRQVISGDVEEKRPNAFLYPTEARKWDARSEIKGMPKIQAMEEYVDYVQRL